MTVMVDSRFRFAIYGSCLLALTFGPGAGIAQTPAADSGTPRRAAEEPLDGIFPSTSYLGPTIGVPDTDPIWPLTRALWDEFSGLEATRIKIYGWLNAGGNASSSRQSNVPESYSIVP